MRSLAQAGRAGDYLDGATSGLFLRVGRLWITDRAPPRGATEQAFRALAWNGRHLIIGFAGGEIAKLPTNLALLKGGALIEPRRYV